MMRRLTRYGFGLLLAAAVGCEGDRLLVQNQNSPDRERALARATDVENLVAGQLRIIHNVLWSNAALVPQLANLGMESYSANANFGMNLRSAVPRALIDNSRGSPGTGEIYSTFSTMSQAARAAALGLNRYNAAGFTFIPTSVPQLGRAKAFAFFVKGLALGYTALIFDSAAVIQPGDDLEAENPLVDYNTVMAAALADLDSAIAIASVPSNTNAGANGFPIPNTWMAQAANVTAAQFVQLANFHKARFRAGVARTPAERALVNWAAVINEATLANPTDMSLTMANVTGGWFYNPMQASTFQSWHQMISHFVGMADTSGNYLAWLNTTRVNKQPFLIETADTRFPGGTDRAAQNASSGCVAGANCNPPAGQFMRNRLAGNDVSVDGLAWSFYDYHRFQAFFSATPTGNGPLPFFPRAEMDLLIAEGHIRASNFVAAMSFINLSRVARGLPALAGLASLTDLIPGAGCTPRVPIGPTNAANATPTAVACGNIMEAMKWEKRMEIAFLYPGGWYFEGRGWGDLPVGTPIHFPVPFRELDARARPIYSVPAVNAASGTYSSAERLSNSASGYGLQ
jgi:hypothetical protein